MNTAGAGCDAWYVNYIITEIRKKARYSAGFVQEATLGMATLTPWQISTFGDSRVHGSNIPGGWTVADEFRVGRAWAVSELNSYGIWINSDAFSFSLTNWLSGTNSVDASGNLTALGEASLLHEVLHKFGKFDGQLKAALGVSDSDYLLHGSLAISMALKEKCW